MENLESYGISTVQKTANSVSAFNVHFDFVLGYHEPDIERLDLVSQF